MMGAVAPITALLLSVFILFLGNGLQGTVLPIRGYSEAFSSLELGILGAIYYAGFTLGCLGCPIAIKRAGHIRAFAVFTTIASSSAILHAMIVNPLAWFFFRGLTGFCFAGIFMVIESWLNDKGTNENRGQLLSVYQIVQFVALTGGQLLLNLANPDGFELFALITVLISLAIVPVSLTTASAPAPVHQVRIRLKWLYGISPVAVVGCLAVGLANGAFWALAPVFAQRSLLSVSEIAYFMGAAIVGGAVLQWPLGRLSDRFDRRHVAVGAAAAAALAGLAMGILGGRSEGWLLGLSACFGGFAFPLYSLCIAHANDYIASHDRVGASGGLMLTYGVGAVAGPLLASAAVMGLGTGGLFALGAAIGLATLLFAFWRMAQRSALPLDQQGEFQSMPRTSPYAAELGEDPDAPGRPAAEILPRDDEGDDIF